MPKMRAKDLRAEVAHLFMVENEIREEIKGHRGIIRKICHDTIVVLRGLLYLMEHEGHNPYDPDLDELFIRYGDHRDDLRTADAILYGMELQLLMVLEQQAKVVKDYLETFAA